jgi:hypothetical protein
MGIPCTFSEQYVNLAAQHAMQPLADSCVDRDYFTLPVDFQWEGFWGFLHLPPKKCSRVKTARLFVE